MTRHRRIREFGTGGGSSGEKGKLSGLDEVQGAIPGPPGSRNFWEVRYGARQEPFSSDPPPALVAVGSAVAADLPVRKAAPVDYVAGLLGIRHRLLLHPRHGYLPARWRFRALPKAAGLMLAGAFMGTPTTTLFPADADALAGNIGRDGGS